jgi:hypothetical protein
VRFTFDLASLRRWLTCRSIPTEVTQLLLNYRLDGTPFWNLLCCIPLKNAQGELTYFIVRSPGPPLSVLQFGSHSPLQQGGQTNITGSIASGSGTDLSFILGGDSSTTCPSPDLDPSTFSPDIRSYKKSYQGDLDFELSPPTPSIAPSLHESSKDSVVRPPPVAENGGSLGKRFLGAFRKKSSPIPRAVAPSSQLLPGAELLSGTSAPIEVSCVRLCPLLSLGADLVLSLQTRIAEFTATYEKLVIFQPNSTLVSLLRLSSAADPLSFTDHEILFVTSPFLRFCGLPGTSMRDVYASPLLHRDLLTLLGGEKGEKKEARAKVKKAVKASESLSIPCCLRFKEKGA